MPLAELPECPQLWPRLVALDLSHNSLGGAVPEAALASMTALQTLDMSFQASLGFGFPYSNGCRPQRLIGTSLPGSRGKHNDGAQGSSCRARCTH